MTYQLTPELAPRHFLTITSLGWAREALAGQSVVNGLTGKKPSYDSAKWRVTNLSCIITHSAANVCFRRLGDCVFNYTPVSAMDVDQLGHSPT